MDNFYTYTPSSSELNTGVFEFDSVYSGNTTDVTQTSSGSGVHNYRDLTLNLRIQDRDGQEVTDARDFLKSAFLTEANISILEIDGTVAYANYQSGYKQSSYTFTEQSNIDIFGFYAPHFGIKTEIKDRDDNVTTSEFYFYGNRPRVSSITVTDTATGHKFTSSNGAASTQVLSGISGQLKVDLDFLNSPEYTNFNYVDIYWASGVGYFNDNPFSADHLAATKTLSQSKNQSVFLYEENLPQFTGTDLYLTIKPYSTIGLGDQWTVGPFKFEYAEKPNTNYLTEISSGDVTGALGFSPISGGLSLQDVTEVGAETTEDVTFKGGFTINNTDSSVVFYNPENSAENAKIVASQSSSESSLLFQADKFVFQVSGASDEVSIAGNTIGSFASAILLGTANTIHGDYDGIVAGTQNVISGDGTYASDFDFIGAGSGNQITGSSYSSIVGGIGNHVYKDSRNSFIGGGTGNVLEASSNSVIGGGINNYINSAESVQIFGSYITGSTPLDGYIYLADNQNRSKQPDASDTLFIDFEGGVDVKTGDLAVAQGITMGGNTVATQSWVTSQNYLTSETDDQTLDEVLTQGNTSNLGIDVGAITGSGNIFLHGDNQNIFFGGANTFVGESSNSQRLKLRGGGSNSSDNVIIDNDAKVGLGTIPSYGLHLKTNPDIFFEGNIAQNDYLFDGGGENLTVFRDPDNTNRTYLTFDKDDQLYIGRQGSIDLIVNGSNQLNTLIKTDASENDVFFPDGKYGFGFEGVEPSALVHVSGDSFFNGDVDVSGSLAVTNDDTGVSDIFSVDGVNGRLFGVTDEVTGTVFSVNDAAGLPIVEVESTSTYDKITMGEYGSDLIVLSGQTSAQLTGSQIASESWVASQGYLTSETDDQTLDEVLAQGNTSSYGIHVNQISGTSLDITTDVTVTGDVEADEFIGDLRGAVSFRAKAGEALSAGDVVYISGINGNTTVVAKADADDSNKMPAFGVSKETVNASANVRVINFGSIGSLDTSAYSEGEELFVSDVAGQLTGIAPTGEASALQKMAKVTRSHASSGSITVMGAGRSNAVPNLNEGRLFVGNSSNEAVADDTAYIDIANSRVGIGTTSPAQKLVVSGSTSISSNLYIGGLSSTGTRIQADSGQIRGYYTTSTDARFHLGRDAFASGSAGLAMGGNGGYSAIGCATNGNDLLFSTNMSAAGQGAAAERMRIDSSGNVGIGTTSPSSKLHVIGTGGVASFESDSSTSTIKLSHSSGSANEIRSVLGKLVIGADINNNSSGSRVSFNIDGSEKMRITSSGNVGIGTTSPNYPLEVAGQVQTHDRLRIGSGGDNQDGELRARVIRLSNDTGNSTAKIYSTGQYGRDLIYHAISHNFGYYANTRLKLNQTEAVFNDSGADVDFRVEGSGEANALFVRGSDGNVGIGTTSPTVKLHVEGVAVAGTTSRIALGSYLDTFSGFYPVISTNNHGDHSFGLNLRVDSDRRFTTVNSHGQITGGAVVIAGNGHPFGANSIYFMSQASGSATSGTEVNFTQARMIVKNDGNVGIGTTSPSAKLHVHGTSFFFDQAIFDDKVGIGTTNPNEKLEVAGKAIIRNSGTATAHADTDLLVTDATASGSTAAIQILGGNAGFSNLQFSDTDSYSQGAILYSHADNYMAFKANAGERMRITSAGNVGIGTASPQEKLDISGGNIRLDDGQRISWSTADANIGRVRIVGNESSDFLAFTTDNSERLRINSSGKVGIGTTSPQAKLQVSTADQNTFALAIGNDSYTGGSPRHELLMLNNGSLTWYLPDNGSTPSKFQFYSRDTSSYPFTIDSDTANVGIGTTSPNTKLHIKENGYGFKLEGLTDGKYIRMRGDGSDAYIDAQGQNYLILNSSGNGVKVTSGSSSTRLIMGADSEAIFREGNTLKLRTNSTDRLFISSGGNVGIGTTSPDSRLHVVGSADSDAASLGSEIVASQTASGTNWSGSSIATGYTHTAGSTDVLLSTLNATTSKLYRVEIETTNVTAGRLDKVSFGGIEQTVYITNNQTRVLSVKAISTGPLTFECQSAFVGTVTVSSVKEIVASDSLSVLTNSGGSGRLETRVFSSTDFFLGDLAGENRVSSGNNIGIGYAALQRIATAGINLAIGNRSLSNLVNGSYNVAIGHDILGNYQKSGNVYNIGIGNNVMDGSSITGNSNIVMGFWAGADMTSASGNLGIGYAVFGDLTSGSGNLSLGNYSLTNATSGGSNVALGGNALQSLTTTSGNIAIGYLAGRYAIGNAANETPSQSIYIGYNSKAAANGETNQIVIGYDAEGIGANTVTLGNDSIVTTALKGNVGIGTTNPDAPLSVKVGSSTTEAKVFELVANDDRVLSILQPDNAQNNDPWTFATNNSYTFRVDAIDALNIDYAGNVGIGTTNPQAKLEVNDATSPILTLRNPSANPANAGMIKFIESTNTDGFQLTFNGSDNKLKFISDISGTEAVRMVIQRADGNVGIGTAGPTTKLHVEGNTPVIQIRETSGAAEAGISINHAVSGNHYNWFVGTLDGNARKLTIGATLTNGHSTNTAQAAASLMLLDQSTGNVGIGTTSPSERLHIHNSTGNGATIRLSDPDSTSTANATGYVEVYHGEYTSRAGYFGLITNSEMALATTTSTGKIRFYTANNTTALTIDSSQNIEAVGSVTAYSFIKDGGANSEFLKADGSIDSNSYLTTSSASSTYLPLSGGTMSGDIDMSDGDIENVGTLHAPAGTITMSHASTPSQTSSITSIDGNKLKLTSSFTVEAAASSSIYLNAPTVRFSGSSSGGAGLVITASATPVANNTTLHIGDSFGESIGFTGRARNATQFFVNRNITSGTGKLIDFQENGTSRFIVDSSGNVGIGTPTTFTANTSADKLVIGSGVGNQGITIYSGDTNSGSIYFADDLDEEGAGDSPAGNRDGVIIYSHSSNNFNFKTSGNQQALALSNTSATFANNVTINNDLTVSGDFTVNGTTSTINSTTLQVDDKNIELGTVATPTDTTADGGGITLKGATDKTINWVNSTDAWTFSNKVSTSEITTASGTLTLNPAGSYVFLPSGKKLYGSNIGFGYQSNAVSAIKFLLGASIDNPDMRIERSSNDLLIQNEVDDGDILFKGSDGGSTITALTLDMSAGGNATFGGSVTATSLVKSGGSSAEFLKADGSVDSNTYLTTSSASSTYLPLAGGTMTGNINLNDDIKVRFGDAQDLELYHSSAGDSYIVNKTGVLDIRNTVHGGDIKFQAENPSGTLQEYFRVDGGAELNRFLKNTKHGDNVEAIFGDSADLKIYHDGTNSRIANTTGELRLSYSDKVRLWSDSGVTNLIATAGGATELYNNGSKKFETTSTGTITTGNVLATNNIYAGGANGFVFGSSTSEGEYIHRSGNDIKVHAGGSDRLTVDGDNGNVGIGTTTPQKKLDVYLGTDSAVASIAGTISSGEYAGLHFGYSETGNELYRKSAIVFERTDLTSGNAQGKVHILNGPQTGSGSATLSDAKLTIAENGNVGIGTTSAEYELHVIGTASFTDTVAGAYFEENASNPELKELDTGTILTMNEEGEIVPSCKANDTMVFGASKRGYKQPIVMGAEPIKMTGPIKVGDFITTSSRYGHGMRSETKEVGTIIAQAMESGDGDSYNIKAMIRKM